MNDSKSHHPKIPPKQGVPRSTWEFVLRVVSKAGEDNIFFMAGAITFNLLVAFVPLVLLIIGISGVVLTSRFPDPAAFLVSFLLGNLPTVGGEVDLLARVEGVIDSLLADSAGVSLVGLLVFLWISTRLVGTLRTVLQEIFDFTHGRGVVKGKLFDALMVVVGGLLFVLNIGITVALLAVQELGVSLTGLQGQGLTLLRQTSAQLLAFGSIWVLLLSAYPYFLPGGIPWRTAMAGTTFTILSFWIYYRSIVFILGGEVARSMPGTGLGAATPPKRVPSAANDEMARVRFFVVATDPPFALPAFGIPERRGGVWLRRERRLWPPTGRPGTNTRFWTRSRPDWS
jgi:uncharacterized BrkB/YihY/UPF0761 family membrane protein